MQIGNDFAILVANYHAHLDEVHANLKGCRRVARRNFVFGTLLGARRLGGRCGDRRVRFCRSARRTGFARWRRLRQHAASARTANHPQNDDSLKAIERQEEWHTGPQYYET